MPREAKARFKILLMGDARVGKTSLMRRYVSGTFDEGYQATIGTSITKHVEVVLVEGGRTIEVDLVIWDIMGDRGISDLLKGAYFRGAKGALAVFDITRRETFESLAYWVETARDENPRMPILVLGNKSDLGGQRKVSEEEVLDYCEDLRFPYLPTSAKTGSNVETAFWQVCRELLKTYTSFVAEEPLT